MQNEWDTLRSTIISIDLSASSWKSDRESLLKIIDWAEEASLDPTGVASIDMTKLRTIIKEVKKAINWGQKDRVDELFSWAKELTVVDLRQRVGISIPEDIEVKSRIEGDDVKIIVELTITQFERMKASTKPHFNFILPESLQYKKVL